MAAPNRHESLFRIGGERPSVHSTKGSVDAHEPFTGRVRFGRSISARSAPISANRSTPQFRIGCAGWSILSRHAGLFDAGASHLARYATRFDAVEINSSFYRPHAQATYARWAGSVPRRSTRSRPRPGSSFGMPRTRS